VTNFGRHDVHWLVNYEVEGLFFIQSLRENKDKWYAMDARASPEGEGGPPNLMEAFQMTPTDVKLVKECRDEAFYYRCLPLMVAACGATHFGVKAGKLSGHPKYGSLFKVFWAGFFGNILGKISYQGICNEKLKADPNSLLGRSLRKRSGQVLLQPTDPTVIDTINKRENPQAVDTASATGYDELRRRNRQGLPMPPPSAAAPPPDVDAPLPPMIEPEVGGDEVPLEERPMNRRMPVPRPKRNAYGDVIEDD